MSLKKGAEITPPVFHFFKKENGGLKYDISKPPLDFSTQNRHRMAVSCVRIYVSLLLGVTSICLSSIQIFLVNLNEAAGSGTGDKVRAMLTRCSGSIGTKKRPDSRKLFERKNSNIHLQNDNFRTGCQTKPVRWLGFF